MLASCAIGCADGPVDEARDTDTAIEALRARLPEPLPLEGALQVHLTDGGRRRFAFTLPASAHVALVASASGSAGRPALAIERVAEPGHGQRGALAKSHGSAGGPARIALDLRAGRYLVSLSAAGPGTTWITLASSCTGAGCPEEGARCPFGDSFAERDALPDLELIDEQRLRAGDALGPDPAAPAQIVAALHASSHVDVRTVAEAFAAADQGELRRVRFIDRRAGSRYVAWEYGAGDNSYGGYFAEGASRMLAAIHDGDVTDCVRVAR